MQLPAPGGQSAFYVHAIGDSRNVRRAVTDVGRRDCAAPGLMTRATSSRWMPFGTGMPAGTSAVISRVGDHVVGSVGDDLPRRLVGQLELRAGQEVVAEDLHAEVGRVVAARSVRRRAARAGAPASGGHWQSDRQRPAHWVSDGGSQSSPDSSTPLPHSAGAPASPTTAAGPTLTLASDDLAVERDGTGARRLDLHHGERCVDPRRDLGSGTADDGRRAGVLDEDRAARRSDRAARETKPRPARARCSRPLHCSEASSGSSCSRERRASPGCTCRRAGSASSPAPR